MPYSKNDPVVSRILGTPSCPGCGGSLTYEAIVDLYFCEVCDKEKMEEYYKKAKEKRMKPKVRKRTRFEILKNMCP